MGTGSCTARVSLYGPYVRTVLPHFTSLCFSTVILSFVTSTIHCYAPCRLVRSVQRESWSMLAFSKVLDVLRHLHGKYHGPFHLVWFVPREDHALSVALAFRARHIPQVVPTLYGPCQGVVRLHMVPVHAL